MLESSGGERIDVAPAAGSAGSSKNGPRFAATKNLNTRYRKKNYSQPDRSPPRKASNLQ